MDNSESDVLIAEDGDFAIEQLEAAVVPEIHGVCACSTSCKCTSCSCVVWW